MQGPEGSQIRKIALHLVRVGTFALIVFLIHRQHAQFRAAVSVEGVAPVSLETAGEFFASPESISKPDGTGLQVVSGADDKELGYVVQTSPKSDHVVGYSGPNNVLIAFGADDRIVGVRLLSSGDTRDHAEQVADDEFFFDSFNALTAEEAARFDEVDAVSGATLTSLAIVEGVVHRLGGTKRPGRFPAEVDVAKATNVFPQAAAMVVYGADTRLLEARDASGASIGLLARTTPHSDKVMGYQGPTDALIALEPDGKTIKGLALNESYDNQPYVRYVAEDEYFLNSFNGWTLEQLAATNLFDAQVEGVSGATMTSVAMAEGMQAAAGKLLEPAPEPTVGAKAWKPRTRDIGTTVVVVLGLVVGFTRFRASKRARIAFQIVLIGYLGFINGDMVSQALLVGWAQNGVAWRFAPGLVLLTAAALIAPVVSKRNLYCRQLCPFGAAQDLVKNRLPWRARLPKRLRMFLEWIPALLLGWVVVAAALRLSVNLAGIEPFDAFVWKVAGASAIAIAVAGLLASLFVPMAYCRFGCPTGALLDFLRFNNRSDQFGVKDAVALALVVLAAAV